MENKEKINKITNQKETDNFAITRIDIINKRDTIYDFFVNSIQLFKEFLAKEVDNKWNLHTTKLEIESEKFKKELKIINANIESFRTNLKLKRNDFVKLIKKYATYFSDENSKYLNEKFAKLNLLHKNNLAVLEKQIQKFLKEKDALITSKSNHENITKIKIEKLQKDVFDDEKLDLRLESQEVKDLISEHKTFVRDEIDSKLVELNRQVLEIKKEIEQQESKNVEDIYLLSNKREQEMKSEFKFLADMEKEVILKTIRFQDFLEDVEYFGDDQTRKYTILFQSKKIIKLNTSQEILKDINSLFSSMATTDKLFDDVNVSLGNVQNRIDEKANDKLLKLQSNILGSTKTSTTNLTLGIQNKDDIMKGNSNDRN